jgi:aspartate carbamoyltransferase catalytic subunit
MHTCSAVELRHVLDARQFERSWFEHELFPLAARLERTPAAAVPPVLTGKRLFYLFYEPSTRTRVSFETAALLLGATVTGMDSHEHRAEDERIEDRVRVLNEYGYDMILVRHHEEGGAARAASVSRAPVINAGDGSGQHPTQALLDVYTLLRELGRLDGLRIALVGDLSYQRSTNSLAYLLATLRDLQVYLVSPELLRMRADVRDHLIASGARVEEVRDLREVAPQCDAVYMTRAYSYRLQHAERFDGRPGSYTIDRELLDRLPPHARVLHPLPRGQELSSELDVDERIACFRQARNGLFVRMALLDLLGRAALPT